MGSFVEENLVSVSNSQTGIVSRVFVMWAAANSPKPAPVKKVVVKRTRLICAAPSDYSGDEVVSANASPFEKKTVEAVGEGYERLLERYWGVHVEIESSTLPEPSPGAEEEEDTEQAAKFKSHKKKKGQPTADLYELLGLGHLRWQATAEDIKLAYRKSALLHHPDKSEHNDDAMFKAVGAAWDTLSDPKKRRDYDSSDPFDDALPSPDSVKTEADFFRIYGPVFRNNAKWSKKTPVPDLGDINSPYAHVENFYTFWLNFQSWREFAYLNEYEPEQAESREEKRWMERKNAKLQESKRKEEVSRLLKLVDQAYNKDPRIVARKEAQKAEKDKKKNEKAEAARRAREEEAKRVAAAEAERLAAEEATKLAAAEAKAAREKQKKLLRKRRQLLRQFGNANQIHFEEIERICEVSNLEQLEAITADTTDIEGTKTKIRDYLESIKSEEQKKKEEEERLKAQRAEQARLAELEKEVVWTSEELSMLTKALARFPSGSVNRWESISAYMNHSKTEAEIIAKIKSVKTKDLKEKPPTRELEDSFQRFLKVKKDATVVSSHSVRYDGADVGPEQEAEKSTKQAAEETSTPASSTPASTTPSSSANSSAASTPKTPAAKSTTPVSPSPVPAAAAPSPAVASPASTPATPTPAREWTAEEQSALEIALKKYPSTTENRWDVIAAAVPGRTKKECVERFKYLVSIVKGQKK